MTVENMKNNPQTTHIQQQEYQKEIDNLIGIIELANIQKEIQTNIEYLVKS